MKFALSIALFFLYGAIMAQEVYDFNTMVKVELGQRVEVYDDIKINVFDTLITVQGPEIHAFDIIRIEGEDVEVQHAGVTHTGTMYRLRNLAGKNLLGFVSPYYVWFSRHDEIYITQ